MDSQIGVVKGARLSYPGVLLPAVQTQAEEEMSQTFLASFRPLIGLCLIHQRIDIKALNDLLDSRSLSYLFYLLIFVILRIFFFEKKNYMKIKLDFGKDRKQTEDTKLAKLVFRTVILSFSLNFFYPFWGKPSKISTESQVKSNPYI